MSRRAGTSSKYSTADSDPLEAPTEHLNKAKKKKKEEKLQAQVGSL